MAILDKLNLVKSASISSLARIHQAASLSPPGQNLAGSGNPLPPAATKRHGNRDEDKRKQIDEAVRNISGYVQNISRELNFSVDKELGRTIVTVIDEESGEVIRQIPSEEMLEIARSLSESNEKTSKGILFKGDA